MAEDAIVSQLTDYGLDNEEARAYIALNKLGPSKASTLASVLKFDRVKTYRILDSLRSAGVVESSLSKPMRFTAVSLEKAVDSLIVEFREKVTKMEASKEDLLEAWAKLPTLAEPLSGPKFKIHQGRLKIHSELSRMTKLAKQEILLLTTRNDLNRMLYSGVYDALAEASRAGKSIRILTQIDKSAIEMTKEYEGISKLRHMDMPGLASFYTVDNNEILISVTSEDSMKLDDSRDVALSTDATEFVRVVKVFFQTSWEGALDAQAKIQSLVSGVPLEELRIVRSVEEYAEMFTRMLSSAKNDVTFVVNLPNPKLLPQNSWEILQGLSARGVKVRLITSILPENLETVTRLQSIAEVKHSNRRLALQMLISDRKEVLLAPSTTEDTSAVFMWSNIKAYVYLILQLADELWGEGIDAQPLMETLRMSIEIKESLTNLQKELNVHGLELESPGRVQGLSGVSHKFDVLIRNAKQPKQFFVADIRVGPEAIEPQSMLSIYARMVDIKPTKAFLLSISPSEGARKGADLASMYGIEVIVGKDSRDVCLKLLKVIAPLIKAKR